MVSDLRKTAREESIFMLLKIFIESVQMGNSKRKR
jgi:hypothetical protein